MKRIKLYNNFKKWTEFDCIYVYSDPHFGDEDYGWPSSEERVNKINKTVHKNDCLIILGDIGDIEYVKKIKCGYKVLVMGNHDKGASNYYKHYYAIGVYSDGKVISFEEDKKLHPLPHATEACIKHDNLFDEVYEGPIFINEKTVLSHEPIKLPFGINIHGHDHAGVRKTTWANENTMFNVASNVIDFTPIRLDKLVEGVHCADIHRLAIDKQKKNKKNRDCCMKGGSCQMCDHYKKCPKECK